MILLVLVLIILLLLLIIKGFKIVQPEKVMIIERLGKYKTILVPGRYWINPILEAPKKITWQTTKKNVYGQVFTEYIETDCLDMRECVYEFSRQDVITKDNASININALIYFQIIDAESVAYEIQNPYSAIEKLTQATLRNIIGEMILEDIIESEDLINEKLMLILDDASQKWGIKINRVELQDIIPPSDVSVHRNSHKSILSWEDEELLKAFRSDEFKKIFTIANNPELTDSNKITGIKVLINQYFDRNI